MANVKTSDETAAGALTGTELVRVVQGGVSVRTTAQDIADLASGGAGDVVGPASATDGAFAVFDGVTGKLLEPSTVAQTQAALQETGLNASAVGFRGIPQNAHSANYTFVAADAGTHQYHPAGDTTARTWTIPANASVAFPIGTAISIDNDFGAGAITLAITTDTLVLVGSAGTTGSRTIASGGQATILKVTSTRWRISGVGVT